MEEHIEFVRRTESGVAKGSIEIAGLHDPVICAYLLLHRQGRLDWVSMLESLVLEMADRHKRAMREYEKVLRATPGAAMVKKPEGVGRHARCMGHV
jgi:hypothetical protein